MPRYEVMREATQQALEALLTYEQYIQPLTNVFGGPRVPEEGSASAKVDAAITALRAALAEPEDWELRRLREELERCKQTCAATSEAWREEAALAEPVQKPLSIEQIEEAWDQSNFTGRANISFARAIERAHGIGG